MGLEDFQSENAGSYQAHPPHEYNSKLRDWADEFEERFPTKLDIDTIEVSPKMTTTRGAAYYEMNGDTYIRISRNFIESSPDEHIKLVLLHEMAHVYFYNHGYTETNHDKYFRWVVGRVGANMTYTSMNDKKWESIIQPFIDMQEDWD